MSVAAVPFPERLPPGYAWPDVTRAVAALRDDGQHVMHHYEKRRS